MQEALPANFRNNEDVKYGLLRVVDIPAEVTANVPWFNQTLTTVNDAVVRLGIFRGDFRWHKHVDQDEFFLVLSGEISLDFEGRDSVVLGPSDDGGYYLIGLKQLHCSLFEEIDWSTERVLDQTIDHARQIGVKVHLLPAWYDVDDRATLRRLCQEFFAPNGGRPRGYPAPATRSFLDDLLKREGRNRIWPNESQP